MTQGHKRYLTVIIVLIQTVLFGWYELRLKKEFTIWTLPILIFPLEKKDTLPFRDTDYD